MQIGHQISFVSSNQTKEQIHENIPDEYKEYSGELGQSLVDFKQRCSIKQLYIYPNFQFRWVAPPTGWVGTFATDDKFKSGAFNLEMFRSFTAVKLKLTTGELTEEKLNFIKERVSKCLPQVSNCPASIHDNAEDGWGCSLGEKGCSIGIYKTTIEHLEDGSSEEVYYLICHSSLPSQFIDEIIENNENINSSVEDFILRRGSVRQERLLKAKPLSFEEEFCNENEGKMYRMKQIAIEHPKRLMFLWSALADVKLDTEYLSGGDGELDEPSVIPDMRVFFEWYKKWPKGALIQPFSTIENYPIGKAVAMLPEQESLKLDGLNYDASIVSFQPDCQTLYNTFHVEGNAVNFYNHTTRQEGSWLVHKGLELGFDCYNYDPINRMPYPPPADRKRVNLDFGKGWPVIYPFKIDPLRRLQSDTLRKFFTSNDSIDQLKGKFYYPPPEDINQIEKDLTNCEFKKVSFQPVLVYLSDKTADTNIALYKIKKIN